MLVERPIAAAAFVLVLAAAAGMGISYAVFVIPFIAWPPPPGEGMLQALSGFLGAFVAGPLFAGLSSSKLLVRRQLPLARVPWYILAAGYGLLFFVALKLLD